ncbi:MAG: biosynthetic-type acetolactate synthase large subunit [Oscillospiraceae bacterium]|jgi:acetolactate synthase-1/2/3 large subunit|nr:biosynthetic-type acetolactate synthase large subunit [Oscillospiraceae bacterium]
MKITGAEIIVNELINQGVEIIFGYPGGYVIDIYDALYNNSKNIQHILTAHEQGAAFAADAYARVSGKVGVVFATGGPGATNLITGIANAYLDSVPVVFITGNVAVPMLGQDSFQDIDIIGVTLPIVKHSYVVRDVKDLQQTLTDAFNIAQSGRKGPVHIDIPKDVQKAACEYISENINKNVLANNDKNNKHEKLLSKINEAVQLISNCKQPYIYCGGGVTASGTGLEVVNLSKILNAPIGMSMMGIGAVPSSYELNLGMSGMHGRYASNMAKSEADLIIALGIRFSDRATGAASKYSNNTKIIHIDIDNAEIGKNIYTDVSINGDLKEILPVLLSKINDIKIETNKDWLNKVQEYKTKDNQVQNENFSPGNIISTINTFFDEDTIVTTDVGQHQMWTAQYYGFEKPCTFISSGGLGAMGYGMGAAIGACFAADKKRTLLITGDGSFGMNLTELATAVTNNLPITIILLNNNSLGMVRQWQTLFFNKHYSNTTLNRKTNFPTLAKAFGADGISVSSIVELKKALANSPSDKPYLIECVINIDEQVLPMIPPGAGVAGMIWK